MTKVTSLFDINLILNGDHMKCFLNSDYTVINNRNVFDCTESVVLGLCGVCHQTGIVEV